MGRSFKVLGLGLLLASCVTAADVDQRLGTWVGMHADVLAESLGAPRGSYRLQNGSTILSYERSDIRTVGTPGDQWTDARHCQVNFTVDGESGRISKYKWTGDAEQCLRLVPEAQAPEAK